MKKHRLPLEEQNPHNPYTAQVDKPIWKGCIIAFLYLAIPFAFGIFLLFKLSGY